jgi:hypothetical protein
MIAKDQLLSENREPLKDDVTLIKEPEGSSESDTAIYTT